MKLLTAALVIFIFTFSTHHSSKGAKLPANGTDTLPFITGNFTDDYGIHYKISETLWIQVPVIKYHILRWNRPEQYLIARNDDQNPTDPGLYTRIDYMQFRDMKPWIWGFCYTAYKAETDSIALATAPADRSNPRKGCNGFPFSRMMKTE